MTGISVQKSLFQIYSLFNLDISRKFSAKYYLFNAITELWIIFSYENYYTSSITE